MSVAKATSAGAWSALDIVLRQVVQFGVSVLLARLLSPDDFGIIAIIGFFSSLSIVFVQGGLTLALVQRTETTHDQENAVFWTNLCAGVLFALLIIVVAPTVASFYEYPVLSALMYVAAAQVVLSAFGAVHTALLTRSLRFDLLTRTGILSSLSSAAAATWAALAGWGVWALAVQLIVTALVGTIALWWVSDWRPTWRTRFGTIRNLYRFGFHLSVSSILEVLHAHGFTLVIAKIYGPTELGYLARAANTQSLPTGIISQIIARTALPLLSARADDRDALLRGFRAAVSLAMLLSVPLMAGLAVLSDLVIFVVFGEKWMPAAPVLKLLAISGIVAPLHVLNLQLLLAVGDSRSYLKLEIYKKIASVACIGVGCFFGIIGVAYSILLLTLISFVINARPAEASIGYGPVRQLIDLRGIAAAALFMSAGVYGLKSVIVLPPLPLLAVLVAAGGLLYLAFGLAFRVRAFSEALALVADVLHRRPAFLRRSPG